jgi:hypothetical protein
MKSPTVFLRDAHRRKAGGFCCPLARASNVRKDFGLNLSSAAWAGPAHPSLAMRSGLA